MTDSVAQASAEARERGWAAEQWRHFLDDVIRRPTIGPVASWLILGLVTLVGWLTRQYAQGAATGTACGGSAPRAAGGVIPVDAGYGTILAVTAITLMAGMQPVLEKRFTSDWSRQLSDWFAHQHWALRAPVTFVSRLLGSLFQIPAWVLSFADYLLARPVALLAGAGLSPFWLRYGVFFFWMAVAIAATWLLPAPAGLWGFSGGAALVIGVVRRWNWVEADREAFFVARRQRKQNERIGFAEDLRDEALVALVFLFVLIPLGLRQVELMQPETFCINGASGADAGVLAWLGFFGAELAKSVPFVDWSEVFHVANGSPIEPHTVLGAQLVFAMRATLDLLMIAAVVQAVQLASRLAEQNTAFAEGDIDILEPFVERLRLHALGVSIDKAGDGKVIEHKPVADFPSYSPDRLQQIVKGGGNNRAVQAPADAAARRAALVLAAKQAVGGGRPQEATTMINAASRDVVKANRQMALRLAAESIPTALMASAYAQAKRVSAKGGSIDVDALLRAYPEQARPLALRAIRSALGELDVMVPIPAGTFMMGAPETEEGSGDDERPQHEVRVAKFEIGKYPVTFDEYDAFAHATGADRPDHCNWGRGNRPVIFVNWFDARAYVAWLNSWSDGGFRLPSESEWEYACRAGTTTPWSFDGGETRLTESAWFHENSEKKTHPVGEKLPNAFKLHDMHGNVREWIEDCYCAWYDGAPDDGSARPNDGNSSFRVLRGGSWFEFSQDLRSAKRVRGYPSLRDFNLGFRVARTV